MFLWNILTVRYDCTDGDGDGEERSLTGPGLDLVPELEEDETTETLSEDEHQSENTALWGGRSQSSHSQWKAMFVIEY